MLPVGNEDALADMLNEPSACKIYHNLYTYVRKHTATMGEGKRGM